MKQFSLLFIILAFISCSKRIEKDTVVYAQTIVSSIDVIIGGTIDYEVHIIYNKDIDFKLEDISFDERSDKSRIISIENKTKDRGAYKERIIKYKLGFYEAGQFVIYPFKISYNFDDEAKELYGEDIAIFVHPFSDGETLPPMKNAFSIPMPNYIWLIAMLVSLLVIGIIILIYYIVKYIERKFNEKINIKEDTEALNALKIVNYQDYYNEKKYAEYYFELTFIFKRYLTKRFNFNIEDMTTSEINDLFKENEFNDSEYIIKMFEDSNYIKFAKQIPQLEIMKKDYEFCMNYIINNGNLETELKIKAKERKRIEKEEKRKLKKKKLKKN